MDFIFCKLTQLEKYGLHKNRLMPKWRNDSSFIQKPKIFKNFFAIFFFTIFTFKLICESIHSRWWQNFLCERSSISKLSKAPKIIFISHLQLHQIWTNSKITWFFAILSFHQPRLKINSLTFCNMIFQS